MKANVCLLAVLLFVTNASSIPQHALDAINDIIRIKRSGGDACAQDCLSDLNDKMKHSEQIYAHMARHKKYPMITCRWYEPDQIREMCIDRNDALKCLDPCQESTMKNLALTTLNAFFICDDKFSKFSQYYPCINKTCDDVEKTCSAKCQSVRGDADKLYQFQDSGPQNVDLSTAQKIVGDSCKYLRCYTDCMDPILSQQCGSAAADIELAIVDSTMSATTNLITKLGGASFLPETCVNFRGQPSVQQSTDQPSRQSLAKTSQPTQQPGRGAPVESAHTKARSDGQSIAKIKMMSVMTALLTILVLY